MSPTWSRPNAPPAHTADSIAWPRPCRPVATSCARPPNAAHRATAALVTLLDTYGAGELAHAIAEAQAADVPHPNAVRQVLERRREQRQQPPPLTLTLPDNDKARHIVVRPASLAPYDQLHIPPTEPRDDATD